MLNLQFGLTRELPEDKTTAWGARWIFPADFLWDRQDFANRHSVNGERLYLWINGGPLVHASAKARQMATRYEIQPDNDQTVTLYEDETGRILANACASFGYLYVVAYLKTEVPDEGV